MSEIISAAVLLILIMDPLGNLPIFMSVLKHTEPKRRRAIMIRELLIALLVMFIFLFAGEKILVFLNLRAETVSISGGIILFLIGKGMGGHFGVVNAAGIGIIFYLAMVSAVAYTLWSVLLAWNDVSRVAIFGFVNPLFSVILSALVLGEVRQAFNMGSLIALFLVCVGIYVVNQKKSS